MALHRLASKKRTNHIKLHLNQITLQPALANQLLTQSGGTAPLARLKIGDQLYATVLNQQGGKAELRLPGGVITAKAQIPLQTGQQLKLTVSQLQPQVTLSIGKPAPAAVDAFSQRLFPRQQPLQQALQNLNQLLPGEITGKGGQEAIQRLLQQLPTLVQLFDPKMVKRQISNSGSFMESRLLNNRSNPPTGDLKMQLLQIKAQLLHHPENSKVVRQIESMIARIELNQLKSIQSQSQTTAQQQSEGSPKEAQQRSWSVEIPFLVDERPEQLALHFRHHQETGEPEKERWHIELNLDPPGLGAIEVHAIHHQQQLDIHFLAEKAETARVINGEIEQLETALSVAGIETGTLFSRQKTVNDAPQPHHTTLQSTGFSIKA